MKVIETYDPDAGTTLIDGRSYPLWSLLEDDEGIRWMLMPPDPTIKVNYWLQAAAGGASAIVQPGRREGSFAAVTTERFMEERTENGGAYALANHHWLAYDGWCEYRYLAVEDAPETRFDGEEWTAPGDGSPGAAVEEAAIPPGFVHLHTHTDYSPLDGLSTVVELTDTIVEQGGWAVGATDHGFCAVHPPLQKECEKRGLKPVFGLEAYLVDDRLIRIEDFVEPVQREGEDKVAFATRSREERAAFVAMLDDYYHICLWATDDESLRTLWALSTESFRDGFRGKPRIDWDTLARLNKGLVASSACLRGPLTHHGIIDGNLEAAEARLGRLLHIFEDRFYIEVHTNHLPEQIAVNEVLVEMARRHKVPLLAAVDSHYPKIEDREAHRVWLSIQTNKEMSDEGSLFAGGQDYHLKTDAEVREALAYLGADVVEESIANTGKVAMMATARIGREPKPPIYSKAGKGTHEEDAERLLELCLSNWHLTEGKGYSQEEAMARFEHEYPMIVRKQFPGYFLMTADLTNYAKDNRILVGPGRGSGAGSLVAYLSRITGVDPIEAELIFERFMTEGRTALPDFDVDFPASRKRDMQQRARDKYGEESVTVVGSVGHLKNKGILSRLGSAMRSELPESYFMDLKLMSAIITAAEGDTAGLGLSWEDLWLRAGDELGPFREKYPRVFEMADRLVGRVSGYGQHAAGLIITTEGILTDELPLRRADEDGWMIAQFDKDVLEELGYIKFDLLTLRTLDTIQMTVDLIEARRGIQVDVNNWRDEYNDPQVWEEVANAHTLGIFQIETHAGTRMMHQMQPHTLAELADAITLVRPGPKNSGLTDTYLRRRNGEEQVSFPDPRLEQVLAKTYGCLLYQEDIMQTCMVLAGYGSDEADGIRKILGKKQVEKVAAAGQEFVSRAVEHGMDRTAATALWAQMAEFAKYSFNRAHAFAYAVLGYWCAWLKFHYPVEFLTSALSTVDADRVPDFIKEARRMGYSIAPPDINESGKGFKAGNGLVVRYGLDAIKGIGDAALAAITQGQPYTSFEDYMARKGSDANSAVTLTLARIGAFDTLVPNRRGLETMLLADKSGESSKCVDKDESVTDAPNGLPCHFDWASEPPPVNPRTGKNMKAKPPPKKCTKACRQYRAPEPVALEMVQPYTEVDIREIEQELLGVFLSSTPFDMLDPQDREVCREQHELLDKTTAREGLYLIAGVLTKVRAHKDRTDRPMGFIALETEVGTVDAVVFNNNWEKYQRDLVKGTLVLAEIEKGGRGNSLYSLMPVG